MKNLIIIIGLVVSTTFGMRTGTEATALVEKKSDAQLARELGEYIDSIQKAKEQAALEKKWKMLEKVLMEIVDDMEVKKEDDN
jgi:hypothetical protein